MKITKTLPAVLLLAICMPALAGQFYKWVDAKGVTHYDLKPPGDDAQASEQIRTYGAASSDQAAELERLNQRRQAQANADQRSEQQAQEDNRQQNEPEQVKQERCAQQRNNLEILTNRPTVRTKNPQTGEMEVIDQERRAALLEDTRKALEFCEAHNG